MKKTVTKIFNRLEKTQIPFWYCIFLIYLAVFFRAILESFVNPSLNFGLPKISDIFFHYPLWYFSIFLSLTIIIFILTKEEISKIFKLISLFSFFILIAPVIDLILGSGFEHPYTYNYLSGNFSELKKHLLTFLGGTPAPSLGIRLEIALGLLMFAYYIFIKTKNIIKSLLGSIFFYLIIFFFGTLPTLIFCLKNFIQSGSLEVSSLSVARFFYLYEPLTTLTGFRTLVLDWSPLRSFVVQNTHHQFSLTMAGFLLIIDIILASIVFWIYSPTKFIATIKNARYLRFAFYYLSMGLGIYFGSQVFGRVPIESLYDFLAFLSLFLSFFFAGLFAIWENDEEDIKIDAISNPERPLVKNIFSIKEWRSMKFLFLFLSLNFAFLAGLPVLIFILSFIALYHIYSTHPLRLKRIPVLSSVIIALNFLLTFSMGFFLTSGTENFKDMPLKYILGIFVIILLGENIKNLKDVEGDKREGIKTLPVLLGRSAKPIMGILVFTGILLVPILFYFTIPTFILSVVFGLILFLLINREKYQEKYVFVFSLLFVFLFILTILLSR